MIHQEPSKTPKKIALVHDFLLTMGGAERVLAELATLYPTAPIYTLLADEKLTQQFFPGKIIKSSFLEKFPLWLQKRHKLLLLLYPVAAESLNLRDYDVIISSSGAWTKGIVTRLHTTHIAYLHSPMRYVWDSHEEYLEVLKKKRNIFLRGILSYLRIWDFEAAQRPEVLVANSLYTKKRIEKYYRREAALVYPSSNLTNFKKGGVNKTAEGPFFLLVSRLTKIKRIDAVIEAFNKLGFTLKIVGNGPEMSALQKKGEDNIHFLGFVPDSELLKLYAEARALIFPSEEDFGLTALEAHAAGTPVIAYHYGGIQEIVIPGVTGELFVAKTHEVISEAVLRFTNTEGNYSQEKMLANAEKFSQENFREGMLKIVEQAYGNSRA